MPFPKDKRYTTEEFFKLTPESNFERYELINGEITALAAPSEIHQRIIGEVYAEFRSYIKSIVAPLKNNRRLKDKESGRNSII